MSAKTRLDRLAVLIDAENISQQMLDRLFSNIDKLGTASVKRAYGDFSESRMKCWETELSVRAIQAIQQFTTTTGKNASDIALVIDAMDLLHSGRYDGFCIVSGDSDFTRLASRLRADGVLVYGFGGKQPAESLIAACDKFTVLDIPPNGATTNTAVIADPSDKKKCIPSNLLLKVAKQANANGSWAPLSKIGKLLKDEHPDFDYADYGKKKLRDLLEASGKFQIKGEGSAAQARINSKT